ncbi:MAG TPA: tRNA uridine-5-carboxymethylaminomethyl(34) synthesis enzyme MnmG, partial [Acidobacteria bacterium]|nr:tRNA uridine-5-carboxymethylaminomethyl(34) synthesis enzyme MnmG [Acidobacteriota bacterium]
AQCDKARYTRSMRRLLEGTPGIELVEGEAVGLVESDRAVTGVVLGDGRRILGRRVILSTGTFLSGVLHTGDHRRPGGRFGEEPSRGLSGALESLGLRLLRLKTGTPPRLDRSSIDFGKLEVQRGDDDPRPFSWRSRAVSNRAVCWVTRTPEVVQRIIGDNLHRSPLFAGAIEGTGPRYCPSIEDKVVRFPHHTEHTVFLEPEGLDTPSIYLNGLSTSLPRDVQERIVRAIPGLEGARFLRYGYAVEYDGVPATQVERTLAVRGVEGLFLCGQILGTSGYEEAAALGFLAGVNAVLSLRGEAPLVLGRGEAYLGVLVDDLVTREQREPYRMLTSRAEHRLVLGVDSARERLMARGVELGLVPERVFHVEQRRWERRRSVVKRLEGSRLNPDRSTRRLVRELAGVELNRPSSWAQLLRRTDLDRGRLAERLPELAGLDPEDREIVVARLRYAGYVERHRREIARLDRLRSVPIPEELLGAAIPGLSREVRELLERFRPANLEEAESLPGMTPAAVAILAGRLGKATSAGEGGDG